LKSAIVAFYNEHLYQRDQLLILLLVDLPPVKPSAIALGTAAQQANSKEEYFHSKEAATAAASWGSSIVGSAVQTYGVGALINATGTLTYKGAAYLGSLIFMASAAPSVRCHIECICPPWLHH
jgi:hypothetical protein